MGCTKWHMYVHLLRNDKHMTNFLFFSSCQVALEVKPKNANSTFLLSSFDGTNFAACTTDEIYLWVKGKPGCVHIPQKVVPSAMLVDRDTVYIGNIEGAISVYSISAGRLLFDLNKVESDGKGKSLMSQMRTKVNLLRTVDEILFVSTETGMLLICFDFFF